MFLGLSACGLFFYRFAGAFDEGVFVRCMCVDGTVGKDIGVDFFRVVHGLHNR